MENISIVRKTGVVSMSILILCQLVTSVVFYWRSRKVKEINWLPKLMMGLANIDGIISISFYIPTVFFQN